MARNLQPALHIVASFALALAVILLWNLAMIYADTPPPSFIEIPSDVTITTISTPTLPARFTLLAPAFFVSDTAFPFTLTLHTGQFSATAKLAYRPVPDTVWRRLPMRVDADAQQWHVPNAPPGEYALVNVAAATALPINAIIVDDLDSGFYRYGPSEWWYEVTDPDDYYLEHAYWTYNNEVDIDNRGEWHPPVTMHDGLYDVQVFIPSNHASTAYASYYIQHSEGGDWQAVDQSEKWAEWVSLGVYTFTAATNNYVELTDLTYELTATKYVAFDALAFIPQIAHVYLPIIERHYVSQKQRTGIHLGSRQDIWPSDTYQRIRSTPTFGGSWPRAIVVLSDHVFLLDRHTDGQCTIAQARWKDQDSERYDLYDYLTEAHQNGVTVIIRINPSPGNFLDWEDPGLRHILQTGMDPAGSDYCDGKFTKFRALNDIATEMHEIYKLLNVDWDMTNVYFEPANEPNNEWYSYWEHDEEAQDRLQTSSAWYEMDTYFSALYDHVKSSLEPNLQVLTPSMAQGNYAETKRFEYCESMAIFYGQSGYELMAATYTSKNDGYNWHNYWRPGREPWVYVNDPCPDSNHVFQYFPQWIQTSITSSSKPAFITESDLFSPCQDSGTGITDKDAQSSETRSSLLLFVR